MTEQPEFEDIPSGSHVFMIDDRNTGARIPNRTDLTFVIDRLEEELSAQAKATLFPGSYTSTHWLRDGVPAKLLMLGLNKWIKGKIRAKVTISFEFRPDPSQD